MGQESRWQESRGQVAEVEGAGVKGARGKGKGAGVKGQESRGKESRGQESMGRGRSQGAGVKGSVIIGFNRRWSTLDNATPQMAPRLVVIAMALVVFFACSVAYTDASVHALSEVSHSARVALRPSPSACSPWTDRRMLGAAIYVYAGCYVDNSDYNFLSDPSLSGVMSLEDCKSAAYQAGSARLAMQYPQASEKEGFAHCFFNERIPVGTAPYVKRPDSECKVEPSDNILGGDRRNAVYVMQGTPFPSSTAIYVYAGCYVDNSDYNFLSDPSLSGVMSLEDCKSAAYQAGSARLAMQYPQASEKEGFAHCFFNERIPVGTAPYVKRPDSECKVEPSDNILGGDRRNAVYVMQGTPFPSSTAIYVYAGCYVDNSDYNFLSDPSLSGVMSLEDCKSAAYQAGSARLAMQYPQASEKEGFAHCFFNERIPVGTAPYVKRPDSECKVEPSDNILGGDRRNAVYVMQGTPFPSSTAIYVYAGCYVDNSDYNFLSDPSLSGVMSLEDCKSAAYQAGSARLAMQYPQASEKEGFAHCFFNERIPVGTAPYVKRPDSECKVEPSDNILGGDRRNAVYVMQGTPFPSSTAIYVYAGCYVDNSDYNFLSDPSLSGVMSLEDCKSAAYQAGSARLAMQYPQASEKEGFAHCFFNERIPVGTAPYVKRPDSECKVEPSDNILGGDRRNAVYVMQGTPFPSSTAIYVYAGCYVDNSDYNFLSDPSLSGVMSLEDCKSAAYQAGSARLAMQYPQASEKEGFAHCFFNERIPVGTAPYVKRPDSECKVEPSDNILGGDRRNAVYVMQGTPFPSSTAIYVYAGCYVDNSDYNFLSDPSLSGVMSLEDCKSAAYQAGSARLAMQYPQASEKEGFAHCFFNERIPVGTAPYVKRPDSECKVEPSDNILGGDRRNAVYVMQGTPFPSSTAIYVYAGCYVDNSDYNFLSDPSLSGVMSLEDCKSAAYQAGSARLAMQYPQASEKEGFAHCFFNERIPVGTAPYVKRPDSECKVEPSDNILGGDRRNAVYVMQGTPFPSSTAIYVYAGCYVDNSDYNFLSDPSLSGVMSLEDCKSAAYQAGSARLAMQYPQASEKEGFAHCFFNERIPVGTAPYVKRPDSECKVEPSDNILGGDRRNAVYVMQGTPFPSSTAIYVYAGCYVDNSDYNFLSDPSLSGVMSLEDCKSAAYQAGSARLAMQYPQASEKEGFAHCFFNERIPVGTAPYVKRPDSECKVEPSDNILGGDRRNAVYVMQGTPFPSSTAIYVYAGCYVDNSDYNFLSDPSLSGVMSLEDCKSAAYQAGSARLAMQYPQASEKEGFAHCFFNERIPVGTAPYVKRPDSECKVEPSDNILGGDRRNAVYVMQGTPFPSSTAIYVYAGCYVDNSDYNFLSDPSLSGVMSLEDCKSAAYQAGSARLAMQYPQASEKEGFAHCFFNERIPVGTAPYVKRPDSECKVEPSDNILGGDRRNAVYVMQGTPFPSSTAIYVYAGCYVDNSDYNFLSDPSLSGVMSLEDCKSAAYQAGSARLAMQYPQASEKEGFAHCFFNERIPVGTAPYVKRPDSECKVEPSDNILGGDRRNAVYVMQGTPFPSSTAIYVYAGCYVDNSDYNFLSDPSLSGVMSLEDCKSAAYQAGSARLAMQYPQASEKEGFAHCFFNERIPVGTAPYVKRPDSECKVEPSDNILGGDRRNAVYVMQGTPFPSSTAIYVYAGCYVDNSDYNFLSDPSLSGVMSLEDCKSAAYQAGSARLAMQYPQASEKEGFAHCFFNERIPVGTAPYVKRPDSECKVEPSDNILGGDRRNAVYVMQGTPFPSSTASSIALEAVVWTDVCQDVDTQKWMRNHVTGAMQLVYSFNLCLDIAVENANNGAELVLWTCNGNPSQGWSKPAIYVYAGCYVDNSDYNFLSDPSLSGVMSLEDCKSVAYQAGSARLAMQYPQASEKEGFAHCFFNERIPVGTAPYVKRPDSECKVEPSDNILGGDRRNAVYVMQGTPFPSSTVILSYQLVILDYQLVILSYQFVILSYQLAIFCLRRRWSHIRTPNYLQPAVLVVDGRQMLGDAALLAAGLAAAVVHIRTPNYLQPAVLVVDGRQMLGDAALLAAGLAAAVVHIRTPNYLQPAVLVVDGRQMLGDAALLAAGGDRCRGYQWHGWGRFSSTKRFKTAKLDGMEMYVIYGSPEAISDMFNRS
eukprot:gene28203-31302_t